jgi:hypothetical protein
MSNYCFISTYITALQKSPIPTMPPLKPTHSVRAKRLLRSYAWYSRGKAAFAERCHKHQQQLGTHNRRSLQDDLRSMLSEVKLLSDDIFDILQPEFLETDAAGSSSDDLSAEESSDEVSDEDSSDDDLDLINEDEVGEDISMSEDTSSDDDSGTLADDKLNTTNSFNNNTTNNPPPSASLHMQVINELKQMYSHRYKVLHIQMPKPHKPFLKHLLKTLKAMRPDHFRIKL